MNNTGAAIPLQSGALAITAFALALGTFMQVLDTTIANVSLPTIAGDLGVSANQGIWVITAFAVANGVSVPLTGWLMQRYGVVRTFVTALLLFTMASFLCGIAWSLPSLVAFRILQGAVSGPMIPGSQALLLMLFPPHRKATALAIWSMTTLIAPICGPLLGGYISDNISWPWIFFINLPVGIFAAYVSWSVLGKRDTPTRRLPVDRIGLLLLVIWVGALQIMLDKGKDLDWFSSGFIIALAAIAVIGFLAFMIWELTEQYPIVDLSLFRIRNFTLSMGPLCLGYAVFFGSVVLMPLWLQTKIGYTATWAGLTAVPSGIIALLISPLVGYLLARHDARLFATISFLSFALSYYLRTHYTVDASFAAFVWPMLPMGIGMGTFFISMLAIMLEGVPPEKIPAASGVSNFLRITAGAFATSLITTFWDRRAAVHQAQLAETSSIWDARLQYPLHALTHNAGQSSDGALAILTRQLEGQAYLLSTLDIFWVSAWISLAMIVLVWFARRPSGGHAPIAAE